MAMERYGNRITVNGTVEFQEQIAGAAATASLPLTFEDAALERRRQVLLSTTSTESHDLFGHHEGDKGGLKNFDIKNSNGYKKRNAADEVIVDASQNEGQSRAFLRRGEEITVMPTDQAGAQRQKRVISQASIKTKWRSR